MKKRLQRGNDYHKERRGATCVTGVERTVPTWDCVTVRVSDGDAAVVYRQGAAKR